MSDHPGEQFLRRVTKRHIPPFWIDYCISPNATTSRFRVLDGRDDAVATFTKWSYAVLAVEAMAARCGVEPAPEAQLRADMRSAQFRRVGERERRRARGRRIRAQRARDRRAAEDLD